MRILVVDDDDTLRLTLRSVLETRGYEVVEAENGEKAVELVEAGGGFQFVILDVNMPKMSGLEALEKIKQISPTTFCLILTA